MAMNKNKHPSGDDLFALVLVDSTILCAGCTGERYPDRDYPGDATPVLHSDDWKGDVAGLCSACGLFVDPEASP